MKSSATSINGKRGELFSREGEGSLVEIEPFGLSRVGRTFDWRVGALNSSCAEPCAIKTLAKAYAKERRIYNIYRYNSEECKQTIGFHCAEQTERTKRATPRVTNKTKTF